MLENSLLLLSTGILLILLTTPSVITLIHLIFDMMLKILIEYGKNRDIGESISIYLADVILVIGIVVVWLIYIIIKRDKENSIIFRKIEYKFTDSYTKLIILSLILLGTMYFYKGYYLQVESIVLFLISLSYVLNIASLCALLLRWVDFWVLKIMYFSTEITILAIGIDYGYSWESILIYLIFIGICLFGIWEKIGIKSRKSHAIKTF